MNILLVSQCTKRALTETRRILDQFAERRGDRTWQTPITQQGLDTLRMLLRKTARKTPPWLVIGYAGKTIASCFGSWVIPNNSTPKVPHLPT